MDVNICVQIPGAVISAVVVMVTNNLSRIHLHVLVGASVPARAGPMLV